MDMICETAIGVKINAQTTESQVIKWIDESMDIIAEKIARIWYHIDFIFERSSMGKELERNFGQFRYFIDEIIDKWRNAYEQDTMEDNETDKPKTFLQQLLKLSEEGASFTNRELRDEVMTFILAGSETTASTLGFTLLSLGMLPEIQESVYQELITVIGNRTIEYQDLPQLQYMDKVLKETSRLFPVGPSLARSATEDIKLETCTIPAGSTIAVELIGLHRDSEVWPNPLEFKPDRFLPEEIAKRHPYSWLPFSGGSRNCIGIKYAWMSMKTILAALLKEYRITTEYKSVEDIHLKHNITLRPTNGYKIAIEVRN